MIRSLDKETAKLCNDSDSCYKQAVSVKGIDDQVNISGLNQVSNDCLGEVDEKGVGYRGNITVTKFGYNCQRWDSQFPNEHSFSPEK